MANRQLDVHLDGVHMGSISMSAGGALSFRYATDYLDRSSPTPLSLSMPLDERTYSNRVVLPFLRGLLPDNDVALASMARTYGVSAASPFALLEHVGRDVAGALQILPPGQLAEDATADRTDIAPIDDEEITTRLAAAIEAYEDGRPVPNTQRMSLAGAQPKIGLAQLPDSRWGIPAPGVPTTHIFKPQRAGSSRFPDATLVEVYCQSLAAAAGVRSSHTAFWTAPDASISAVVSTRFDRARRDDATVVRLHQEDFCQALSVSPAKKYQHIDGGPGISVMGRLLETRLLPEDSAQAATDLLAAATVNVALVNTDAHAKNYGLMLAGPHVSLAPLYDVVSIAAYLGSGDSATLPMRFGGTFSLSQVHPGALVEAGVQLGVPHGQAQAVVERVLGALARAIAPTAETLAGIDHTGIIEKTVTGLAQHSTLLRDYGETTAK